MKIPFEIEHIDPLGQGVSKITDKITFLSKVLPGEKGNCQVYAKKSKVQFATPCEITEKSSKRCEPACEHFSECPSCHFLHTDYSSELEFKQATLERQLAYPFKNQEIKVTSHPCEKREGYRNRLQLHYDKKFKVLGQFNRALKKIIPIPNCIIANESVQKKLKDLYKDHNWLSLISNQPSKGHIEIYDHEGELKVSVNQDYSAGGFTQVNAAMNDLALELIFQRYQQDFPQYNSQEDQLKIVDLFGGKGNLTRKLDHSTSFVIDVTEFPSEIFASHQKYIQKNLYHKATLPELVAMSDLSNPDLLILDPPRSGYKELAEICEALQPKFLYYMSCQSDTAIRDISQLKNYQLHEVHLLDFFPSTYHFETLFFLQRNALKID